MVVLVVLVVFASFLIDTTWIFRGVIALYGVAIAEQVAMVGWYGDIPLDTRSILSLSRQGPLGEEFRAPMTDVREPVRRE